FHLHRRLGSRNQGKIARGNLASVADCKPIGTAVSQRALPRGTQYESLNRWITNCRLRTRRRPFGCACAGADLFNPMDARDKPGLGHPMGNSRPSDFVPPWIMGSAKRCDGKLGWSAE